MHGKELKAHLLSVGTGKLTGMPAGSYISSSTAGPGAGGAGSVFFSSGTLLVRLGLDERSPLEIIHEGGGTALLRFDGHEIRGRLLEIGLHCPGQAYITVSSGCIFNCRYCNVPRLPKRRKTPEEIFSMIKKIKDRIGGISVTSGVFSDIAEEEDYVCSIIPGLKKYSLPIGVSIYPTEHTPERLFALGVNEVKFNVETATAELFRDLCPGHDRDLILRVLRNSVSLFGRGHVFSNVIAGIGETDEEMKDCMTMLAGMGVIPVIRPLNPVAGFAGTPRPGRDRLLHLARIHEEALSAAGLDTGAALTMCVRCRGCDLVPGESDEGN